MMGKTHVVIGVSYGLAVASASTISPVQVVSMISGLVIGSLLPDIDHPQSIITRQVPLIGWTVSKIAGHRGLLHSILGVLLLFVVVGFLSSSLIAGVSVLTFDVKDVVMYFSGAIIAGYILHIIADMLTVSGVKLFYPFKTTVRFPIFTTGGIAELILRWCLIGTCLLLISSILSNAIT